MWSILSEELAPRMRIPFRIVMTSSVLRDVFKKVFICDCSTSFSNLSNLIILSLRQVKWYQMFVSLALIILSLMRLMAISRPNRVSKKPPKWSMYLVLPT